MGNMRDSLSGQNEVRRHASAGSSPAPSAKSKRTRLWQRLRRLDRKISYLDDNLRVLRYACPNHPDTEKREIQRDKADAKRRSVRLKLKGTI